jgi:hypothetical protein
MWDRGLKKYDLVDLTSFAKDGSTRHLAGFRAIPYNLPRGCAMDYMPEMNALCPIGDYSAQSDQPLMWWPGHLFRPCWMLRSVS